MIEVNAQILRSCYDELLCTTKKNIPRVNRMNLVVDYRDATIIMPVIMNCEKLLTEFLKMYFRTACVRFRVSLMLVVDRV